MFAYYSNKNDYNSIDLNSEPFKRYMQYRSAESKVYILSLTTKFIILNFA